MRSSRKVIFIEVFEVYISAVKAGVVTNKTYQFADNIFMQLPRKNSVA